MGESQGLGKNKDLGSHLPELVNGLPRPACARPTPSRKLHGNPLVLSWQGEHPRCCEVALSLPCVSHSRHWLHGVSGPGGSPKLSVNYYFFTLWGDSVGVFTSGSANYPFALLEMFMHQMGQIAFPLGHGFCTLGWAGHKERRQKLFCNLAHGCHS